MAAGGASSWPMAAEMHGQCVHCLFALPAPKLCDPGSECAAHCCTLHACMLMVSVCLPYLVLACRYAMTACKAFGFCLTYKRNTEFRRLCDILRQHLANINK